MFASKSAVKSLSPRRKGTTRTRRNGSSAMSTASVASSSLLSSTIVSSSTGYAGASFKRSPPAELVPFPDFDACASPSSSRNASTVTKSGLCPKLEEMMKHIRDYEVKKAVVPSDASTTVGCMSDIDALSEASYAADGH